MRRGGADEGARLEARSRLPRQLVALALRRPMAVLAAWGLAVLIVTPGVLMLEIETSTDSVLDLDSPQWEFYQLSQQRFGGDEIVTVMLEGDSSLDPELLEEVVRLTGVFEALPGVRRVDSLASVPLVEASADGGLSLAPALDAGVPSDDAGRAVLRARLAADRVAPGSLISEDGKAVALNLVLEQGAEEHYDAILAAVDAQIEGRRADVSGVPIFRRSATTRTSAELALFVPLTVAIVGALLWLLFRSLRAALVPLGVSGAATWIVVGVMGATGTTMTIGAVILPPVLLALGSAYCMHFLVAATEAEDRASLEDALLRVALPVSLSGLTTAVGFTAVSFVKIQAVRDVSAFGALGVLVVLLGSLTAAPAILGRWPLAARSGLFERWIEERCVPGLVAFASRRGGLGIALWAGLTVVALFGVARLQVETDVVLWFSKGDPIRTAYDDIRVKLSGISPMNVIIAAPEGRRVSEGEVMAAIDGLADHLRTLPDVGKVVAVSDLLHQLHEGFMPEGALQPLPWREDVLEQYLLLLEGNDYLFDLVTQGRSAANLLLRLDDNGSEALLAVAREAERWWAEEGAPGIGARTTGIMHEFARSEDRIAMGQMQGLGFALFAVAGILLAIFGWPRLAGAALLPNALPVLVAFGVMGLFGVALDAGTVFVGNLALGIAVDDTIHEASEFFRRRALGQEPEPALRGALARMLRPVVFTTLVVTAGFAVLGLSSFTFTRNLGLLTAGVMLLCLLADLFLLPALLLRLEPRKGLVSAEVA